MTFNAINTKMYLNNTSNIFLNNQINNGWNNSVFTNNFSFDNWLQNSTNAWLNFDNNNSYHMSFYNPPIWNFNFPNFTLPSLQMLPKFEIQPLKFNLSHTSSSILPKKTSTPSSNKTISGSCNLSYSSLSISEATKKAEKDNNLEKLTSGKGWFVDTDSFKTDIPYAKKGMSNFLTKVCNETGLNLRITSALGTGTAGNPHVKGGYSSHHNADNPKLDFGRVDGVSLATMASKLRATGYFSRVENEGDHLDVQVKPEYLTA